jgi:hypothetical protein
MPFADGVRAHQFGSVRFCVPGRCCLRVRVRLCAHLLGSRRVSSSPWAVLFGLDARVLSESRVSTKARSKVKGNAARGYDDGCETKQNIKKRKQRQKRKSETGDAERIKLPTLVLRPLGIEGGKERGRRKQGVPKKSLPAFVGFILFIFIFLSCCPFLAGRLRPCLSFSCCRVLVPSSLQSDKSVLASKLCWDLHGDLHAALSNTPLEPLSLIPSGGPASPYVRSFSVFSIFSVRARFSLLLLPTTARFLGHPCHDCYCAFLMSSSLARWACEGNGEMFTPCMIDGPSLWSCAVPSSRSTRKGRRTLRCGPKKTSGV